jgi:hypothetical protein
MIYEEAGESVSVIRGDAALADFLAEFQLPFERVETGSVACVTSQLILFDGSDVASAEFDRHRTGFLQSGGNQLPDPKVGQQSFAFHYPNASTLYCSSCCEDAPGESYLVLFRHQNLVAVLEAWAFEQGGDPDFAVELARRQADRIESVLQPD